MKGLHILLDALDRATASDVPVRARIVAATNAGEAVEYWRPLKHRTDNSPNIDWRESGVLDASALAEFHASIDVLAVPSLWPEYVGFVTLEALALGTRVILSDFPSQRELVCDSASGALVAAGDVPALARELAACWTMKQHKSAQVPVCPAPASSEYARQLMSVYEEVAA
jgi:glycosyltransferase involved in cell wall biosynthesis